MRDEDGLRSGWRGVVGWFAWLFLTVALVLGGFVAYSLFGTRIVEARAQGSLGGEFSEAQEQWAAGDEVAQAFADAETPEERARLIEFFGGPAAPPPPPPGGAVAQLRIPKLGVERVVVEGVEREHLMQGPGHYPGTAMPGREGNAAIAGHRTTYGAPFWALDELVPGDEILVTTLEGSFRYVVRGSEVVDPSQGEVIGPTDTPQLTLTTCNPRYSAATRLVVFADLDGPALPDPADDLGSADVPDGGAPVGDEEREAAEIAAAGFGLGGEANAGTVAAAAAGVLFVLWAVAYWATGRLKKRWVLPVVLPLMFAAASVLWVFAERALPAGT